MARKVRYAPSGPPRTLRQKLGRLGRLLIVAYLAIVGWANLQETGRSHYASRPWAVSHSTLDSSDLDPNDSLALRPSVSIAPFEPSPALVESNTSITDTPAPTLAAPTSTPYGDLVLTPLPSPTPRLRRSTTNLVQTDELAFAPSPVVAASITPPLVTPRGSPARSRKPLLPLLASTPSGQRAVVSVPGRRAVILRTAPTLESHAVGRLRADTPLRVLSDNLTALWLHVQTVPADGTPALNGWLLRAQVDLLSPTPSASPEP